MRIICFNSILIKLVAEFQLANNDLGNVFDSEDDPMRVYESDLKLKVSKVFI